MIAFSCGLVSFNNFMYVASVSASFDADLLGIRGWNEQERMKIT
jgi:hypothetical protein